MHHPTAGINLKHQIFFAQIGGYNTHSAEISGLGNLPTQVTQAINALCLAIIEIGVHNKVVTFTTSDFRRTFQPAGYRTWHSWPKARWPQRHTRSSAYESTS